MLKKIVFASVSLGILFSASIVYAQTNTASTTASRPVIFPIAELGGCTSKSECRVYCDIRENHEACYTYALAHALMRKDEVDKAREINKAVGPGGCMGAACKIYCNNPLNHTVCRAFAEEHNLKRQNASTTDRIGTTTKRMGTTTLPGPAAERAKIELLLKSTVGPGGCKTVETCRAYCADSSHNEECLRFAKIHFLMKTEDVDRAETFVKMRDGKNASSTLLKLGTSTLQRPPLKPKLDARSFGSTTLKDPTGVKPPIQNVVKPGDGIDRSRPPYKCTSAQAEEGACDPDQFPGAPSTSSDQGGAVYNAFRGVLHFFGF